MEENNNFGVLGFFDRVLFILTCISLMFNVPLFSKLVSKLLKKRLLELEKERKRKQKYIPIKELVKKCQTISNEQEAAFNRYYQSYCEYHKDEILKDFEKAKEELEKIKNDPETNKKLNERLNEIANKIKEGC